MRLGTTGSRAAATASASSSMSALPRCRPALAAARRKTSSPRAQSAAAAVVASACSSSLSLSPSSLSLARRRRHQQHRRFSTFVVRAAASFDSLSQSLSKAWDAVRIDGKLTAENIKGPMREIRRALLEADVSLPVVRQFVSRVEAAALGVAVTRGVTPDQQLVKVVYDQLKDLMGGERADLAVPAAGPQVVLLAGLQGVGKTTAAGKLALRLRDEGKKVLLVAADVYRPAAVDQLTTLGKRINVDVLAPEKRIDGGGSTNDDDDEEDLDASVPLKSKYSEKPPSIAKRGLDRAIKEKYDAVIVDTAGRLQIDASMMTELSECAAATKPTDTLLVVDAMTGQEAASLAAAFAAAAPLTGVVLTKLDGDARGGAALSVRAVSGAPIKFVGTGEGLDALEPFYPDRLAGRILGMGDVLTLVEKAEKAVSEADAASMAKKMMSAKFDFDDFLQQYRMVTGMGGLGSMVKMLPGIGSISDKQMAAAEKQFKVYESMIQSMTREERRNPDLLARAPSRRRRVARGSGRTETDVAGLVATFASMRSRMRSLSRMLAAGGAGGTAGMPTMTDDELMQATVSTASAQVSPGKARRRKPKADGRGALSELVKVGGGGGGGFGKKKSSGGFGKA